MDVSMRVHLHSDNFDICRICLLKPESDRQIKFYDVFSTQENGIMLNEKIMEVFGLKIDKEDNLPKIICHNCYTEVLTVDKIKKKVHESQTVIIDMAKKRNNEAPVTPEINQTNLFSFIDTSTHSRNSQVLRTRPRSVITHTAIIKFQNSSSHEVICISDNEPGDQVK